MKARIEVDEMGRFVLILPEDIVEDEQLEDGDYVLLDYSEENIMAVHFE